MKLRETESGNLKLTLTHFEADVIMSVLSYVRLGNGTNSEVIFDIISKFNEMGVSGSEDVTFDLELPDGDVKVSGVTINV